MPIKDLSESSLIPIGFVLKVHGLRGSLRVRLHNPSSEMLETADFLFLAPRNLNEKAIRYNIESAKPVEASTFLVQLEGVSSREAAELLQGQTVLIDKAQLPQLEENEFYLSDLVGYDVFSRQKKMGQASGFIFLGGQDLLQITNESTKDEILVPFVPGIIVSIDKKTRSIYIDPPEGLLELNQKEPG